jgi:hypothetical protein
MKKDWARVGLLCTLLMVLVICLVACNDPVIWSKECSSSNGTWIASARTVEHSGFGTGGAETIVEIKKPSDSRYSERVLAFADDGRAIKLKMQWEGSSHLAITYDADPQLLYYQVLKTSGVSISVQDFSNGQSNPPEFSTREP